MDGANDLKFISECNSEDDKMENIDEVYEDDRKNYEQEDARVAQTIMQGVQEYTEFKVTGSIMRNYKVMEKQLTLDKDLVRLCIIRCFHPDKLMQEIRSFIMTFLGKYFVETPQFEFSNFLHTFKKRTSVMFMLGPNMNMQQELDQLIDSCDSRLIERVRGCCKYQPLGSVSLEVISRRVIDAACNGHWLLLDNLQLALQIIPNMIKFMETMFDEEVQLKIQLEEIVNDLMHEYRKTKTIGPMRSVEMANRATSNEVPPDQLVDPDDEDQTDALRRKVFMSREKETTRQNTLKTLEKLEIEKEKAEYENVPRDPTEIEMQLADMVFPKELAFVVHRNFRLWFSTIPVPGFPKEFARRCKLVSRELPSAIRTHTQKQLSTVRDDRFEALTNHRENFRMLFFSITVMHSVISKRDMYGGFGWTQRYQFSPNDCKISLQILEEVCDSTPDNYNLPMELL